MSDSVPAKPGLPPTTQRMIRLTMMVVLGGGALYLAWSRQVRLGWSDALAMGLSLVFVLSSVRLALESFDPAALGKRMGLEGDSTAKEARQIRLQAAVMGLMGAALALPVLAALLGLAAPWLIYAALVAAIGLRLLYTWHVMRRADEFIRRRVHQNGWLVLVIVQLGLFLYAGAERLGLARRASAWDVLVGLMLVALLIPTLTAALANKVRTVA